MSQPTQSQSEPDPETKDKAQAEATAASGALSGAELEAATGGLLNLPLVSVKIAAAARPARTGGIDGESMDKDHKG